MQYNKERILSRLMEMIQIDSVSYKEGPMTDYLQKYFEDRGYEVYRDRAGKAVGGDHSGNLLIHIPGTMEGESICLNAHQDTVEPGIGIVPVLEDGKLKSSGDTILAADDKSGIAIMLELLEVLKETGTPHRDMYYLFTICEERDVYKRQEYRPCNSFSVLLSLSCISCRRGHNVPAPFIPDYIMAEIPFQ